MKMRNSLKLLLTVLQIAARVAMNEITGVRQHHSKASREERRAAREARGQMSFEDLEIVPFLREGENVLDEDEMVARAKDLGANLNDDNADYMLRNCVMIPNGWRRYHLTITGVPEHNHYEGTDHMPRMYWRHGNWRYDCGRSYGNCEQKDRLVRLRTA